MGNEKEFDFNSENFDLVDYENMSTEEFDNDPFVKWLRKSCEQDFVKNTVLMPNPKMITLAENIVKDLQEYAKEFDSFNKPVIKKEQLGEYLYIDFIAFEMVDGMDRIIAKYYGKVGITICGKSNERAGVMFVIKDFFLKAKMR